MLPWLERRGSAGGLNDDAANQGGLVGNLAVASQVSKAARKLVGHTYRTLCLAPSSEVRQVFDELAAFRPTSRARATRPDDLIP